MAQANDFITTPICELSLKIRLRKSGIRLKRNGFRYELIYGEQVLLSGNGKGEGLALDEIAAFVNRSLVR